ncbi:ABC transporter ATP-binding protein [Alphaproteobacteria bacterium KMM 3653]|uniref:ABC transporter ATP-binding protein n=1 Tax=Harenicola maris TaxID=2841044 RepID=A0AAP2CTK6_9RHOB|nr:ABC transporter ATP-binding protein [Harenicola maris]
MIEISNLSLTIGTHPILRDVSLSLEPAQITGLVGESGSGKSMTALSIMGLLPRAARTTGSITFDGQDLRQTPERRMCAIRGNDIGMIFQEPMTALNPVQTIGAQVAETLRIHGVASRAKAQEIAAQTLARVGLPPEKVPPDRYPHQLSGGQRQRVCIAMAVALRPRVLIADEPTTALDVTTQAQILTLLQDLVQQDGMALLLITHDLAVVSQLADRIAVMQNGQLLESGPARSTLTAPQHAYTGALLAAAAHSPRRAAPPKGRPLLRVQNATRIYPTARETPFSPPGELRAVDRVSFDIKRGESLGLVGESGCGKSTLTRAILGLDALQEGAITLAEAPVTPDMPAETRQKMQVVFQDPYSSFNPRHRVSRILREPFHLSGIPKDLPDRIAKALTDTGLSPEDAHKYPHEFSGGQRQRIALARALIAQPDLIVLDEAVSALDVQVRAQILDLLADLQARYALTYLFISHDLTVVRAVTDRTMVMQAGKIVETGPTEDIFRTPQHPYTRALLAAAPRLETI